MEIKEEQFENETLDSSDPLNSSTIKVVMARLRFFFKTIYNFYTEFNFYKTLFWFHTEGIVTSLITFKHI